LKKLKHPAEKTNNLNSIGFAIQEQREFFLQVFLLSLQVIPLFIFAFPFGKIILVSLHSEIKLFLSSVILISHKWCFFLCELFLAVAVTIPSRLAFKWLAAISIRVLHSHLNLQKHRCGTTHTLCQSYRGSSMQQSIGWCTADSQALLKIFSCVSIFNIQRLH
jgi:hypothetical protein